MGFQELVNQICGEMPEGYQIIIELENGCGCAKLLIPGSDAEIEDYDGDSTFEQHVTNLLKIAKSGIYD